MFAASPAAGQGQQLESRLALHAVRIFGGYGYPASLMLSAISGMLPLMIVGEGTNEIQRNVIARQLISQNKIAP